jgi:uncharacterized membrane protein
MDTSANSLLTIPLATPAGQEISIVPASKLLRTAGRTIYTLGLAIAVAVLFALWLTGKVVILVAALLVMAFDIPAPTSRVAVKKASVSVPKVDLGFDYGLVADPW